VLQIPRACIGYACRLQGFKQSAALHTLTVWDLCSIAPQTHLALQSCALSCVVPALMRHMRVNDVPTVWFSERLPMLLKLRMLSVLHWLQSWGQPWLA